MPETSKRDQHAISIPFTPPEASSDPKSRLPHVTERIVATYRATDTINHLERVPLPSYQAVDEIIEDCKELLYPGFRRRQGLTAANVTYHIGDLIDSLFDRLATQVCRALRHLATKSQRVADCPDNFECTAGEITIQFLEQIPRLRSVLATDAQAAFVGDPASAGIEEVIFCYPGLEAITVYRLAHELYRLQVPYIPRMMTEWAHSRTGIDIHPGAKIDESFFIDHGTGVVIGQTCVIGKHVKLYQGVTLGALSFAKDAEGDLLRGDNARRHPTIEDRVVIYANATVLGGHTVIGHDSVIGSSVWITKSVEPHSTVVLEKPRLRIRGEKPEDDPIVLDWQI